MDPLYSSMPPPESPAKLLHADARFRKREHAETRTGKALLQESDNQGERRGPTHPLQLHTTQQPSSFLRRYPDHHLSYDSFNEPTPNPSRGAPASHPKFYPPTSRFGAAPVHMRPDERIRMNPDQYSEEYEYQGGYAEEPSSSRAPPLTVAEPVRPKVRLYENENEEQVRYSRPQRKKRTNTTVPVKPYAWQDDGADRPYMPGPKADNFRRCLAWARSVGGGSEEEDVTTIDNNSD